MCFEAHSDYLRKSGFELKIEPVRNLSQITLAGVPRGFQGCHLIKIKGYVFEGMSQEQVLNEKSDLVGVSNKGVPAEWMALRRVL